MQLQQQLLLQLQQYRTLTLVLFTYVPCRAVGNGTFGAVPVRFASCRRERHKSHPAPTQKPTTKIINRAASLPLQLQQQLIVAAAAAITETKTIKNSNNH